MEIRIYFGKTPTDKAKFFTRADFMYWYNTLSQRYYTAIQTDEIITPFFNFIDVDDNTAIGYIWNYTYIGFLSDNNNDSDRAFFAVIDRIENSPFDSTTNKYRIYFHCDWWSTLQYNSSNFDGIFSHIRGEVERAHVNDWIKSGDNYKIQAAYTDSRMEENVIDWQINSEVIAEYNMTEHEPNNNGLPVQFLFVISKLNLEADVKNGVVLHGTENGSTIPIPFNLSIIPTLNGKFLPFRLNGTGDISNNDAKTYSATTIIGDLVVAMFFSNISGLNWVLNFSESSEPFIDINIDVTENENYSLISLPIPGNINVMSLALLDIDSIEVNNSFLTDVSATFGDDKLNPFESLTQFKTIGMSKILIEPYFISSIAGQKGAIILHTQYMGRNEKAYILNSPNSGTQYITIDDWSHNGVSSIYQTEGDNTFEVFSEQNWIDVRMAKMSAFSNVFNPIVSGLTSMFSSDKTGNVISSSINMPVNIVAGIYKSQDILRDVALGGNIQISPNYENVTFKRGALRWISMRPLHTENLNEIREHLRLYGYTTYLEPCDILLNHKRTYFNYIKTNNIYFDFNYTPTILNSITQNIKDYIIDMFNNGVFLFRADNLQLNDIMNFEVINKQEDLE